MTSDSDDCRVVRVKQVSLWLLIAEALVLVVTIGANALNLIPLSLFSFVATITDGWVSARVVVYLLLSVIRISTVPMLVGRLTLRDLGIVRGSLRRTLLVGLLLIVAQTFVYGADVLLEGKRVTVDQSMLRFDSSHPFLQLILMYAMVLLEEVIYRGFYTTQLFLWFSSKESLSHLRAVGITSIVSGALFMFMHLGLLFAPAYTLPTNLAFHLSNIFIGGCVLAAMYLLTYDIWIVAMVHALLNQRMSLVGMGTGWHGWDGYSAPFVDLLIVMALGAWLLYSMRRRYVKVIKSEFVDPVAA